MRFTSRTRSGESHGFGLSLTDAGFCTCVWSCSFISFLCRKARHDVQTGSTCVWGQLGLFCGLNVVSWIHYLNVTRKLFFPLEFWNLGLKLWIRTLVSLQDQAYANCGTACLCYSRTWVIRQMLLKIGWGLKPCSFLFKSQGNFLMLVMQHLGPRVNYQFNTILLYSKLKTEIGQHLQLNYNLEDFFFSNKLTTILIDSSLSA